MKQETELYSENQHYYDLGFRSGKNKFNTVSFLTGMQIGVALALLITSC